MRISDWSSDVCSSDLLQPFGRAETAEGMALVEQVLCIGPVHRLAVGLAIGAVRATDIGAFRPGEAGPFQRVENLLLVFRRRARGVGVLDAKDELAAHFICEEIVEQCSIDGAELRLAGRRGGDADTWAGSAHG